MKLYNQTIITMLDIMAFAGTIIGGIYERKYLMYICGFICFFFSSCLCLDNIQRVKDKLGITNENKKETNQYGYIGIFIFIIGCCLSVLFCKLNIHFDFLILLGILLGVLMRRI